MFDPKIVDELRCAKIPQADRDRLIEKVERSDFPTAQTLGYHLQLLECHELAKRVYDGDFNAKPKP